MNNTLKLAVAGAVLAMSSAANAGITIPAGDWTVDLGGNVNGFLTQISCDNRPATVGGIGTTVQGGIACNQVPGTAGNRDRDNINTGLLPSALGIGAKTRQNDMDVAFQFTFFPGISSNNTNDSAFGLNSLNIRQTFLTFGDKSWGTVKVGRDLGIFGSDAILNDMTLLGVGGAGYASGTTTLGRIGTGFIYADWNAQISYASPNWNGFSFKAGVFDPWASTQLALLGTAGTVRASTDNTPQVQGQVSYDWGGDFSGKVWAGGIYQSFKSTTFGGSADNGKAGEIGAHVDFQGFGVTAYGYSGSGVGTTGFGNGAHAIIGTRAVARDSDGGYIQGTYKLPNLGTKLGVAYGESHLRLAAGEALVTADNVSDTTGNLVRSNKMLTVGVYHPLTKSVNLVAEYNRTQSENQSRQEVTDNGISLGAIMFF